MTKKKGLEQMILPSYAVLARSRNHSLKCNFPFVFHFISVPLRTQLGPGN